MNDCGLWFVFGFSASAVIATTIAAHLYNRSNIFFPFWKAMTAWSIETFGPRRVRGPLGPILHLRKETVEVEKAIREGDHANAAEEIADCLFLVIDAANRLGIGAHELIWLCNEKLDKNKARKWPDWRTVDHSLPIEHDRGKE